MVTIKEESYLETGSYGFIRGEVVNHRANGDIQWGKLLRNKIV